MSGYTQEDIRAIVAGSKRANEMKDEIALILNLVRDNIENVHKRQLFDGLKLRVDITETAFLDFIARNSVNLSVHVEIILQEGDKLVDPLGGLEISSVKAVHAALPKVLEEANKSKKPIIVMSNNKPQGAVIGLDLLEKLQVDAVLKEALEEYKAGKTKEISTLKELEADFDEMRKEAKV